MAASVSTDSRAARVHAMESAIVFNEADYKQYSSVSLASGGSDLERTYEYAGSFAGRNIEKIYTLSEAAKVPAKLEPAVRACFERQLQHVLICSGFYVLHNRGGNDGSTPGVAAGSCETDGPLGALALLRAFASRKVHVSLYCEPHNGPIMKAGYDAMLSYWETLDPPIAVALKKYSRCLPNATDGTTALPSNEEERAKFNATYAQIFPDAPTPVEPASLRSRSLRCVMTMMEACKAAWGSEDPGEFDCLFALERLGFPYRNIRGQDISLHTEPIDCLWPLVELDGSAAEAKFKALCVEHRISPEMTARIRSVARVSDRVLTLGVGDGGNEVGMGKFVHLEGISSLSPGGEFAALSVNGTYRTCDFPMLSTVSNWAGTAFEMVKTTPVHFFCWCYSPARSHNPQEYRSARRASSTTRCA